jgi:hypothetical protein
VISVVVMNQDQWAFFDLQLNVVYAAVCMLRGEREKEDEEEVDN